MLRQILMLILIAGTMTVHAGEMDGKSVYESSCVVCHGAGVAGAPKTGDATTWKERIAKGMATLEESAIKGVQGYAGAMPPKGGNASLSDEEVKAAVAYMVEHSQESQ
ncbi:MAG: cytochrome c5 family protein [Gammaproteobacteria bacterium]|nr:cytochrome c5 family protein [Gammaproteobacteria bacterium]